jgi:hypothetical protein
VSSHTARSRVNGQGFLPEDGQLISPVVAI